PLAAWFVGRAFGGKGKTGLFSAISVISTERSEAGKPPGERVAIFPRCALSGTSTSASAVEGIITKDRLQRISRPDRSWLRRGGRGGARRFPTPSPPPRSGEGEKDRVCSPSPCRGGGWGRGSATDSQFLSRRRNRTRPARPMTASAIQTVASVANLPS